MVSQSWRKEPRKNYSNDFKLRMVELASRLGTCIAQIARENGINDNVIFKWLRLWQDEGRISTLEQTTENQRREIEAAGFAIRPQRLIKEYISDSVAADIYLPASAMPVPAHTSGLYLC